MLISHERKTSGFNLQYLLSWSKQFSRTSQSQGGQRNSMEDALDDSSSDDFRVVHLGLANGWSKNQTYKNLITKVGVNELSSNDIFVQYKDSLFGQSQLIEQRHSHVYSNKSLISEIRSEIKQLIVKKAQEGFSI